MVLETDILIAHIHLILTMTRIVKDVQITISAVIVLDSSMGWQTEENIAAERQPIQLKNKYQSLEDALVDSGNAVGIGRFFIEF